MRRLIFIGSPRAEGRSAALAKRLHEGFVSRYPADDISCLALADLKIVPCDGCNMCSKPKTCAHVSGSSGRAEVLSLHPQIASSDAEMHRCIKPDDMCRIREMIDATDELIVVSPLYFAGPPAQFKALLDRLQPYYWSNVRTLCARPLVLHVVGEGKDPFGFDPLVKILASALRCAGFSLECVMNWVGRISDTGEILKDADICKPDLFFDLTGADASLHARFETYNAPPCAKG